MSEKRRDNKNRVLRNGESQRKDGRYMYKYVDNAGNVKYVYSWKLVKTDTVPQGAKDDIPLRDKEKQIRKDLEDDIVSSGGDMTVLELVKKYISQKTGVRHNTEYAAFDYIICMERYNIQNIMRIIGNDPEHKVQRLLDYTNRPRDIADPWYTGNFDETFDDVMEGCQAFLSYLMEHLQ